MSNFYDLVVIGAGPGGYHSAIHAAKKGLKVAVVEKRKVGGTCLNYGCIPTKIMLDAAIHNVLSLPHISSAVDAGKLFSYRDQRIEMLSKGVEGLLKKNHIELIVGEARFSGENEINVVCMDGDSQLLIYRSCIIAVGSVSQKLPFLDSVSKYVFDSDDMTRIQELPESICIIGGGVVGVEFGYIFNALGVKTTIIEILDRVLINEDEMVSAFTAETLQKCGIRLITGAKIGSVKDSGRNSVVISVGDEELEVASIMCAAGRRPNIANMNLPVLGDGILTEKGAIAVNDRFETCSENVYAIGDANGLLMLAHAASAQGTKVVDWIVDQTPVTWRPEEVPKCVFIKPEIASIGLTEAQARVEFSVVKTAVYPMAVSGKAIALSENEGFIKVVADKDDHVLGISIVGAKATELITIATMMVMNRTTIEEAEKLIFPHPTFSEALQDALLCVNGKAIYY